jgi:hypothetical protein
MRVRLALHVNLFMNAKSAGIFGKTSLTEEDFDKKKVQLACLAGVKQRNNYSPRHKAEAMASGNWCWIISRRAANPFLHVLGELVKKKRLERLPSHFLAFSFALLLSIVCRLDFAQYLLEPSPRQIAFSRFFLAFAFAFIGFSISFFVVARGARLFLETH